MTMTIQIDQTGALTNGAPPTDDPLQIIRALLDFCATLLPERAITTTSDHSPMMHEMEEEEPTWEDAEWQ